MCVLCGRIVQLIDGPNDGLSELKKGSSRKKPKENASTVLEEVSQEVSSDESQEVAPESVDTKEVSSKAEADASEEIAQEVTGTEDASSKAETQEQTEESNEDLNKSVKSE